MIAIPLAVIAAILLVPTVSVFGQQGGGLGNFYEIPESIESAASTALRMNFTLGEQDQNRFSDRIRYEVEDFVVTNPGELCPSGECTLELDDAEFRENSASYALVLEGTLKVRSELSDGSGTETSNYDLWGSLDRTNTIEKNDGSVEERLSGDINIDREQAAINFNPDFEMLVFGEVTFGDDNDDNNGEVGLIGVVLSN